MTTPITQLPTRWIFSTNGFYIDISEGTGDNLLRKDRNAGYTGYYNYEIHKQTPITEIVDEYPEGDFDGGMCMVDNSFKGTTEEIETAFKEYLKDDVGTEEWTLVHTE